MQLSEVCGGLAAEASRPARGELVGLLGPNGAGKSTVISLLCGQRKPTSGRVEIFGRDPRAAVVS